MKTLTILLCSLLFACQQIPYPEGEPDVVTDAGLRVYGDVDAERLDWIATWTMARWAAEGHDTVGMLDGLPIEITDEDMFFDGQDVVALTYAEEEFSPAVLVRVERGSGEFSDYTFFHEFSHVALYPSTSPAKHHDMMHALLLEEPIPEY